MRRREPIVGRALRRFVACSVLAFLVFGAGSILLAHHIASEEATRDAVLEASALARGAVAPFAGEELRAAHASPARSLSTVLAGYLGDGAAEHIALVDPGGRVLWADGGPAGPSVVEVTPWARAVLESRGAAVGPPLSEASAPGSAELADVYVGVTDATGRPLLVVATMPVPVRANQWHLVEELVPLALAGMVAFALTSGWLAVSLARRVEGGLWRQAVLERKAFLAADLERRRLARDLHDGVIQELAAASYALPLVEEGLTGQPGSPARHTLAVVGDILTRQLTALRTLMMDVYPTRLEDGGLLPAVEGLVTTARGSGLVVHLDVGDTGDVDALCGTEAALAYRVVREGLTNVVRHAGATTARVALRRTAGGLSVGVADDGRGPDGSTAAQDDRQGLGLVLLRDAVTERGGSLELRAGPDGGSVLTAWLPPQVPVDPATSGHMSEAASGH